MDKLVRVSREILENFDLYGQPIPLRLLAELRQAVEAAQQSVQSDGATVPAHEHSFKDSLYCSVCGETLF